MITQFLGPLPNLIEHALSEFPSKCVLLARMIRAEQPNPFGQSPRVGAGMPIRIPPLKPVVGSMAKLERRGADREDSEDSFEGDSAEAHNDPRLQQFDLALEVWLAIGEFLRGWSVGGWSAASRGRQVEIVECQAIVAGD